MRQPSPLLLSAALATVLACGDSSTLRVTPLDAPTATDPRALNLTSDSAGRALASWLEPREGGGYALRMAAQDAGGWTGPRTVVSGAALATHPTDLPGVAFLPGGALLAHWQEEVDWSTMSFETDVRLATSGDGGATWSEATRPYPLPTLGEHGFVSTWRTQSGVGMAWLDARRQFYTPGPDSAAKGEWRGAMALQGAVIGAEGRPVLEQVIDSVTCECCPTAAAVTSRGPVVVYRDRELPADVERSGIQYAQDVVRDIAITRFEAGRWTAPRVVHADGWVFNGCPNNGPAVAARDERVVVAWMTGVGGRVAVYAAFSTDAGDSFGAPIRVDDGKAIGQVTVALAGEGAIVGWLENNKVMARRIGADGSRGRSSALGPSAGTARLPRWTTDGNSVVAGWLAAGDGGAAIRLARLE
jgi:hypothetical protein